MAAHEVTKHVGKEVTSDESTHPGRTYRPSVDICETEEALWLWADMPGVDENTVDVQLNEGVLSIEGKVTLEDYENLVPRYTEYNVGNFVQRFTVPSQIDVERIRAKMSNGVLELELGKVERAKPRRIEISNG
jgi:HSP20 family molecular chaperone IbpA